MSSLTVTSSLLAERMEREAMADGERVKKYLITAIVCNILATLAAIYALLMATGVCAFVMPLAVPITLSALVGTVAMIATISTQCLKPFVVT